MASVQTNMGNLDLSKIAYTKDQAANKGYIGEEQILTEYWDGDLEVEDMGDGTYLVTKDGTAMGWTSAEGIETQVNDPALDDKESRDKKAAAAEWIHNQNNGGESIYTDIYDGHEAEIHNYEDGSKTVEYAEAGKQIILRFDENNELTNSREIIRDENGQVVNETLKDGQGNIITEPFKGEYKGMEAEYHQYEDGSTTIQYQTGDGQTQTITNNSSVHTTLEPNNNYNDTEQSPSNGRTVEETWESMKKDNPDLANLETEINNATKNSDNNTHTFTQTYNGHEGAQYTVNQNDGSYTVHYDKGDGTTGFVSVDSQGNKQEKTIYPHN